MKTMFLAVVLAAWLPAVPALLFSQTPTPLPPEKIPAVAGLIKDLGSPEPAVQLRARAVLAGMGEEAGPPLLYALPTAGEKEAAGLIELLAFIRYREAAPAVEKIWQETSSVPLKLRAAEALCRFDHNYHRYQGYILSQVQSKQEDERMAAMQMLGYIGDQRVVEPLVMIFNDTGQSDKIRQAAVWDLAHTPVPESAAALVTMVNDPEIEWFYKEIIIAALRRLAAQEGMAPIVSELLQRAQQLPAR